MADETMEEVRRSLAVVVSRVDRHDADLTQLGLELRSLRDRVDSNHHALIGKLDGMRDSWIGTFTEHSRQDLIKDEQILTRIHETKLSAASLRNYIVGIGAGVPVLVWILNFLISSGILHHGTQ